MKDPFVMPLVICDELVGPAMGQQMRDQGFHPLVFLLVPGNGGIRPGLKHGEVLVHPAPKKVSKPRGPNRYRHVVCTACGGKGKVRVPNEAWEWFNAHTNANAQAVGPSAPPPPVGTAILSRRK